METELNKDSLPEENEAKLTDQKTETEEGNEIKAEETNEYHPGLPEHHEHHPHPHLLTIEHPSHGRTNPRSLGAGHEQGTAG